MNRIFCPHCVGRNAADTAMKQVEKNPLLLIFDMVAIQPPPIINFFDLPLFMEGVRERLAEIRQRVEAN